MNNKKNSKNKEYRKQHGCEIQHATTISEAFIHNDINNKEHICEDSPEVEEVDNNHN